MNIAATPKRLILQRSQPEFEAAIRKEFVEGSAIAPELFEACIQFVSDTEISEGRTASDPIADFLNWGRQKAGFSRREASFAALMHNEDGSPWQAKLNYQTWDCKKGKYRKPYSSPKKDSPEENGSHAYLPPIPASVREKIGKRCGVKVPLDVPFWEWVKTKHNIPIILTEGAKKALSLLSQGYVAIAFYGCTAGYSKDEEAGTYDLINDLKPFCVGRGEFVIAFDRDERPDRVNAAIRRMDGLLQDQCSDLESETPKGVIVRVALWDGAIAKGVDDLIIAQGANAIHKAIAEAVNLPQQLLWKCLMSRHHQIGDWKKKKTNNGYVIDQQLVEISTSLHQLMLKRAKWDLNLVSVGISKVGKDGDENDGGKTKTVEIFRTFEPKCDFDFTVVKRLKSSEGGGLVLRVVRVSRNELETKNCYVKTSELLKLDSFMGALSREFGSNLACTLTNSELQALIQNRTAKYERRGGQTYRLANRIGQQEDGIWVFEDSQFKANGTPTTESESLWVFNKTISEIEKISSPKIAPQNPQALQNLVEACKNFFHPETLPLIWFVCGYSVATFERQTVFAKEGFFPQLNLFGDPGGSKTTAAKVAISFAGMHTQKCVVSKSSVSMAYERLKLLGSLPVLFDDPIKKGMDRKTRDGFNNMLQGLFDGNGRDTRWNKQDPNSNTISATNVALGEGDQASESRLIKLHFPVREVNRLGMQPLRDAMDAASGGLSQVLAVRYDSNAVKDIESRLLEYLPNSHARIASSLALLTYFTQKFCDVAGVDFNAFEYCVKHLCPTANNFESDKDSLTDFLEKLAQMRSEGAIGDWNCTKVTSQFKSYLAIVLSDVWADFDRRFSPNYSRQSIEQLIEGRGGKKAPQKFVATKSECIDFDRAMAAYKRGEGSIEPIRPLKRSPRKAILIPESELIAYAGDESVIDSNFSNYESNILEDDQPEMVEASSNESAQTESPTPQPKEDHPHYPKIMKWVSDSGLSKDESVEVRRQLFSDRWKKWKSYSEEDMQKLKSAIEKRGLAKQAMTITANSDDDWSDS